MQEPRESNLNRAIEISVIVAGFLIICAFLFAFDSQSKSLNDFIYRWQTGMAGVAAALAAYVTVNQMERTDKRAQNRHDQILAAQFLQDRLKLRRARYRLNEIDEYFDAAASESYSFERTLTRYAGMKDDDEGLGAVAETLNKLKFEFDKMDGALSSIMMFFIREKFAEAEAYMGPKLEETFRRLKEATQSQAVDFPVSAYDIEMVRTYPDTGFHSKDIRVRNMADAKRSLDEKATRVRALYFATKKGFDELIAKYPAVIDAE